MDSEPVIGIFDSGIGGLSVLLAALRALPSARFLYYADTAHVPYGEKSREEICAFSAVAVETLRAMGADSVVIACNTATSAAITYLRAQFEPSLPIIGMEPAVKPALTRAGHRRILTAATPVTVRGEKLRRLIDLYHGEKQTDLVPLPGLVRLAEAECFDTDEVRAYVREALAPFAPSFSSYSAFVLGCTHFNYFKDTFRAFFPPETALIDGIAGTISRLLQRIGRTASADPGDARCLTPKELREHVTFLSSGSLSDDAEQARFFRLLQRLEQMEAIS